jgi:hypothetical protein
MLDRTDAAVTGGTIVANTTKPTTATPTSPREVPPRVVARPARPSESPQKPTLNVAGSADPSPDLRGGQAADRAVGSVEGLGGAGVGLHRA